MKRPFAFPVLLIVLALASISFTQKLPSSIRGYKVHQVKVRVAVAGQEDASDKDAFVKVGQPRVIDVGLSGITMEATAEISGLDQDGEIDLLTFKDILVNGIALSIDDYEHPFALKKGAAVTLPLPVRGTVSALAVAKAAYKEAVASQDDWRVSGTVFVFGRFKKMGLTFKRVIPVTLAFTIANPVRTAARTH